MTESAGNELGSAVFERIQQIVNEHGAGIRQSMQGNALQLDFSDGQRILVNFDVHTLNVWLATHSGGIEYVHRNGTWHATDHSELFTRIYELIQLNISSAPLRTAQVQPPVRPAHYGHIEEKKSHGLRNVLILLLVAGLGFWTAQRLNPAHKSVDDKISTQIQTESLNNSGIKQQCESNFPGNGSVTAFPENGLHSNSANDPEIIIRNDHGHPLLLTFSAPNTVIPLLSVLIHAHQGTTVTLPAGTYDMMFGTGSSWCNPRSGFSDGRFTKFDKPLIAQIGKPLQLAIQSSGAGMEDFQLIFNNTQPAEPPPLPTFTGDGSMEVQRQANGHFYLPGTVETVPVTFIVDTGASVTSISSDIARQARIRNCKEVQFQTANGAANGCIALVPHMTLGNFELQNITVAVMPNLEANLLGANVLRNFQINQNDSTLLIGRK